MPKANLLIPLPDNYSFDLSLGFLQRSPRELLHTVHERSVSKAIRVGDEIILFRVTEGKGQLIVEFKGTPPSTKAKALVRDFITEWMDIETDLEPFYQMARKDKLLADLVHAHHGYRIIGQPDLFESLVWAVLGQQINLAFAYTLKQRFVERYGARREADGMLFHLFPSPADVVEIKPEELVPLQFSRQKSRYTIAIAEAFHSGIISKEKLTGMSLDAAKEELMKIKGVGNWTANYALMKTFRYPDAFPLEDAALHNALRNRLGLKEKPSLDRVRKIFKKYKGWEAYATLYLWKSL